MALFLDHTTENGAVGNYFRISMIKGICAPGTKNPYWEVWVNFYATQQIRTQGLNPLKQYQINIPFADLAADPRTSGMPGFYAVLKNYPPFAGQAVIDIVDDSDNLALDLLKAMKNVEINNARLAANTSSFIYLDKAVSCDNLSRSDIDGTNGYIALMGAFPPGWVDAWKAIDNTYIPITTIDDWKAFYAAMVSQGQQNFVRAQALKKLVADATTTDAVQSISWDTIISKPITE